LRGSRAFSVTMFRLFHQLACNSVLSANRRITRIASRCRGHRRGLQNGKTQMSQWRTDSCRIWRKTNGPAIRVSQCSVKRRRFCLWTNHRLQPD